MVLAEAPLCCLKADTLVLFLCSGKPIVVLFSLGADGGAVERSVMSAMKAEEIEGGVGVKG